MKKKTSLKDIANIVGVSIPLVSYVLNNKGKENRVSIKTADKIREVAKKLNYHPNLNARSLKTNKTRTIGVIVADIANPFFANLARVIEDKAFAKEYTVIFGSSDENVDKFNRVLDFMMTRQVDGFIIAAPEGSKNLLHKIGELNIPLVLIDRYFKDLDTNYVIIDNVEASLQGTNFLLEKGCKKIGTVLYESTLDHYEDRFKGYSNALNNAGISPNVNLVKRIGHTNLIEEMEVAIQELMDLEADAIYFHTNTLAEEGLKEMIKLDKDVFKKVQVVVFDQNLAYHFLESFIPYVKQPIIKLANRALEILFDQIDGTVSIKNKVCLKTELVSTGMYQSKIAL